MRVRSLAVAALFVGTLTILCVLPVCAAAQATDSLRGLPPVVIDVRVDAPVSAGIGESDLKSAVALRLTRAGIRIEGPALGPGSSVWAPKLFVYVAAPIATESSSLKMYGIAVSVMQFVKPLRPGGGDAPTLFLNTWSSKDLGGMIRDGSPIKPTRGLVEMAVDEFIEAYRGANLK